MDEQALQTELQGLAARSGVTVADLTKLEIDSQSIGQDWHAVDPTMLQQAVSDLTTASALPGTTSPTPTATATTTTTTPQDEFVALFPSADQTSGAAAAV